MRRSTISAGPCRKTSRGRSRSTTSSGAIRASARSMTTARAKRRRRRATTCSSWTPPRRAPVVSIFGGKITTYRRLAEEVLDASSRVLPQARRQEGLDREARRCRAAISRSTDLRDLERRPRPGVSVPCGPRRVAARARLWHAGASVLGAARQRADLGRRFGDTLTEAEVALSRRSGMGANRRGRRLAPIETWAAHDAGRDSRARPMDAATAARRPRHPVGARALAMTITVDNGHDGPSAANVHVRDVSVTLERRARSTSCLGRPSRARRR